MGADHDEAGGTQPPRPDDGLVQPVEARGQRGADRFPQGPGGLVGGRAEVGLQPPRGLEAPVEVGQPGEPAASADDPDTPQAAVVGEQPQQVASGAVIVCQRLAELRQRCGCRALLALGEAEGGEFALQPGRLGAPGRSLRRLRFVAQRLRQRRAVAG